MLSYPAGKPKQIPTSSVPAIKAYINLYVYPLYPFQIFRNAMNCSKVLCKWMKIGQWNGGKTQPLPNLFIFLIDDGKIGPIPMTVCWQPRSEERRVGKECR